jgi:hypothetical protein
LYNDEVNAVILGKAFALQTEKMFQGDLAQSTEITLDLGKDAIWTCASKKWSRGYTTLAIAANFGRTSMVHVDARMIGLWLVSHNIRSTSL